jgi:thiol-disulfide isomerase/thioredoxin
MKLFAIGLLVVAGAFAQDRVSPAITVKDIHGVVQKPFDVSGRKAALVFFITDDCPISNRYAREIHRICDAYASNAKCTLDYIDADLTPAKVEKHMADFGHGNYPAVIDGKQVLVKAAGATVTPEVALIAADGSLAYRGRIDNMWATWGQSRREATELDLRNALDQVVAGKPVALARTKAVGCYITPVELLGR